MKLNEKIKALRLKNNLTQDDLAYKLNMTRQNVSKWEQGLSEPSIETIKELCHIFNVSINELLDNDKHLITTKEQKWQKANLIIYYLIIAITIFSLLSALILIRIMPDQVPIHFDALGNITRYGSKYETLVFAGCNILFAALGYLAFTYARKRSELTSNLVISNIILLLTIIGFIIFNMILALNNAKDLAHDYLATITGLMFAVFIPVSIFALPKFNKRINPLFGFRTSFTLTNKEAWIKINKMQSISGLIASIIGYLLTLIFFEFWTIYLIFLLVLSIIPSFIYHEILRKKTR